MLKNVFLKIIASLFFLIVFFGVSNDAQAANVYYSVGQNATDHKTGTPNVIITSGVATFDVAQTATNMGVGDRLTAGGNAYYIASKTSTTVWNVVDKLGAIPADLPSTAVTSIVHEYTSLSAAEAGASDANHLNTSDLVTGNYILNIPCYYDSAADTTAVVISGWTTGQSNYIKIYTPNNISTEVNSSQRHQGKWDSGKYRLEISSGSAVILYEDVRIIGLQISSTTSTGIRIVVNNITEQYISNNIIKGNNVNNYVSAIFIASGSAAAIVNVYNNIIYGYTGLEGSGVYNNDSFVAAYVYNNTSIGNTAGIRASAGTTKAVNNIVYGSGNTNAYLGTFDAGTDYNATDGTDTTGQGANSKISQTFIFSDTTNNDFHLSPLDTAAKNAGTDLSADANLAFSTDIDGHSRPNGTAWDIGAHEGATGIYRSVGPSATSALATGTSNNLTISGSTATFASALADNIGVGDVIQYDDDNDGDIDASDSVAFISGRTSSTVFTVQSVSGGTPTATAAADQDWSIFRAYISLSNAETGTENTGIDADLRNFDTWSGGRDIYTNNEQWNIACYANGSTSDSNVTFNGWTTAQSNYLKVYTPTATTEVGTSQRHSGKWDSTKYNISSNNYFGSILIYTMSVRIEGLQLEQTYTGADNGERAGIYMLSNINNSEIRIIGNIIKKTGVYIPAAGVAGGIDTENISGSGNIIIVLNNIIDGFKIGIYANVKNNYSWIVENNTIVNFYVNGISLSLYGNSSTLKMKNNLVQGAVTNYIFSGSTTSTEYSNNISQDATSPDTSYRSKTVSFVDSNNDDYHLDPSDVSAKGAGSSLASDSFYSFSTDIDGQTRENTWDIGADESLASAFRTKGFLKTTGNVKFGN